MQLDRKAHHNLVPAAEIPVGALENCDHVAFQHTCLIQSHVAFLHLNRSDLRVLNASINTADILGVSHKSVLGSVLDDRIVNGISQLFDRLAKDSSRTSSLIIDNTLVNRAGENLIARIQIDDSRISVELEKAESAFNVELSDPFANLVRIGSLLEKATSLPNLSEAIGAIRDALEVDHCLLYRFDAEFNGEVITESRTERSQHSYLGLRFPTRDVPLSARRMMESVPVRTAVDQSIDCVPIEPRFDPLTGLDIDLTRIRSRGSVKSCQDFYANLGVRSKIVLPILVQKSLWGMIVCHNMSPMRVSAIYDHYLFSIAKTVGHAIERIKRQELADAEERGRYAIRSLSQNVSNFDASLSSFQAHAEELKQLIPCSTMILRLGDSLISAGSRVDKEVLMKLSGALWKATQGSTLDTNCLSKVLPEFAECASWAAGALVIPLSTQQRDMAIWLRPERIQDVNWAGNPNANVEYDNGGSAYLTPRSNFKLWKSLTKNTSDPWRAHEIALAETASIQLSMILLNWYASQASLAKSEFFACMSHELRTPMTAILGYADLLSDEQQVNSLASSCSEYLETIRRNGVHLLRLIDDILDMAKIESGKLTVERLPVEVEQLAADVVHLMKARADEKRLELRIEFKSQVPRFIATDPVRLRQILLNLIGNAIKFTDSGSVSLVVRVDQSHGAMVVFEVTDTGIGMSEEQQGRLFHAFAQAESSISRRFGGTGLGLLISKNLANLLGGDIKVESSPGQGSTFRVELAIETNSMETIISSKSIAADALSTSKSQSGVSATKSALDGARILLIEDGPDNQRLIAHFLRKAGATVALAENGRLGIELLTTDGTLAGPLLNPFPFDLILTDMQMPEMDGYQAARKMREKGLKTPIIALTAFAMKTDAEKCFAAGCDAYLSKPIDRTEMIETVSCWLRNAKIHSTSETSRHSVAMQLI